MIKTALADPSKLSKTHRADVLFSQALSNPNFSWRLHSYVVRVVRSGGLATGVEVQNNDGSRYIVNLNQGGKIILTAGAVCAPIRPYSSSYIEIFRNDLQKNLDLTVAGSCQHPVFFSILVSVQKTRFRLSRMERPILLYLQRTSGLSCQSDTTFAITRLFTWQLIRRTVKTSPTGTHLCCGMVVGTLLR